MQTTQARDGRCIPSSREGAWTAQKEGTTAERNPRDKLRVVLKSHCATRNTHEHIRPRNPDAKAFHPQHHNASQLAQEIEDRWGTSNAEVDMSTFTNNQLAACLDFHKLANDTAPTSLRARLGQENMQSLVSVPEIQDLLRCFNRIFFPGACTDFVFAWNSNPGAVGSWAREPQLGSSAVPAVQVRLHPTQCKSLPDYPRFSARAMGRLSTLLHEAVHAHLLVYACKICEPSYVAVEDAGGHGAAW
jgi:hypothetical protein